MNDAFAARVYPTILYVLDLQERIRRGRGPNPVPAEEIPRLKQHLGQLDAAGYDQRDYELAKYALVCWIDELLVNSNWSHAGEWKDNLLERDLFDSRDRAWAFYEKANVARSLTRPDALETFYLCVALGFLGIYRDGEYVSDEPSPPAKDDAGQTKQAPSPGGPSPSGSEMISWFGGNAPGPGGDDSGWGLGQALGNTGGPVSNEPAPAGGGGKYAGKRLGGRNLPRTLEEWAGPVYAQIAPSAVRAFAPQALPDSQRDARPLEGWKSLKRSLILTFWALVIVVALIITHTWWWWN